MNYYYNFKVFTSQADVVTEAASLKTEIETESTHTKVSGNRVMSKFHGLNKEFSSDSELNTLKAEIKAAYVAWKGDVWKYTDSDDVEYVIDSMKTFGDSEIQAVVVRTKRDTLLAASDADWAQCTSMLFDTTTFSTLTKWRENAHCKNWATYRTALRDVPTQAGFPWAITWPTAPTS